MLSRLIHSAHLRIGLSIALLGISQYSLADFDKARIDAMSNLMQREVDDGKAAGLVALLAKNGKVEMLESYGYQDLENKTAMTVDSIFRIYSMTKPIAGTALMMLHDQGKFKLSDPVEKYIPQFKGLEVIDAGSTDQDIKTSPAEHPMTVRELMSHSGGLVYTPGLSRGPVANLYGKAKILDRDSTLEDMVNKLGKIPLNAQPGSTWAYSVSVDVQGYLVEVLSGQSFDVFLEQNIFTPLGMPDTRFYVKAKDADRFSRNYRPSAKGLISAENSAFLQQPKFLSGGGGLTSTAADYLRFAQMHLNEGELDGVRILSKRAVELMRSNQLPEDIKGMVGFSPGQTFGLDFAIIDNPATNSGVSKGSYYWWGIAGTWFWIDPTEDLIFIGMIQNGSVGYTRSLHAKSREIIYQ